MNEEPKQMRELKFRGWDGESLKVLSPKQLMSYMEFGLPISQYTGLQDKNGTEIYEGDIIETDYYGVSEVYYCAEDAGYYPFSSPSYGGHEWEAVTALRSTIIGNVYQNPELKI